MKGVDACQNNGKIQSFQRSIIISVLAFAQIGGIMHSIAQTYSDLGRYQLSLDFSKKSLNFRIENCPNDHLEIGHALTLQTIVVEMFTVFFQATP
jgi:hypothetical protein